MNESFSPKQLTVIARENYNVLRGYCCTLDSEGYWDGPQKILNQSVYSMLDLYIETILIKFALFCDRVTPSDISFISGLVKEDAYSIADKKEISAEVRKKADRMFSSPPIILQLCSLRDVNRKSGITGLFFDALINIQLAMAFLEITRTKHIAAFVREYLTNVEAFLSTGHEQTKLIDERYIFKKLCNENLEESAEQLRSVGENFKLYRDKYIFLKNNEKSINKTNENISANVRVETLKKEEPKPKAEVEPKAEKQEEQHEEEKQEDKLTELLRELELLVGLDEVKTEVKSLINLIKVRTLRKQHNLPVMDMSFHMVFTGNPGTGKTTVARLIASIYKELGLLSKGNLVETDRSGLVAGYVGQTALKVREVVEKAIGGVLFIDEAYSLAPQTPNDFGDEAIETLVKLMEDHRDDLVVIVAGYTEEMQKFLKSNTGLTSRFNRFITFKDYTTEELLLILERMAEKAGYTISEEASQVIREKLINITRISNNDFGNARGVRNMFERIVVNQANRITAAGDPDIETLTIITKEDVI